MTTSSSCTSELLTDEQDYVPNGWHSYSLKEIATFRRGSFPQPYGLPKWYDDLNGLPFVQVYDVADNLRLKATTKNKITREAAEWSVLAPKGSILVTLQGSIGRVAITQYEAYVDRTLLIFGDFLIDFDPIFFAYSLQCLFAYEKTRAPGGTIKTITKEVLSDFVIKAPPFAEQRKIAAILSCWDDAIAKINQIALKTEIQRKRYLHELISSTGTSTTLGEVVELIYGKSPKDIVVIDGKYPIIGTGGVVGKTNSTLCNEPSVVVGRKGTIDKPVFVESPFWAIDTTYFTKPKQTLDLYWLLALLQSLNLRTYNESSGVPSLLRETLYTIPIQLPSLETQKVIGNLFRKIDDELSILKELLTRVGLQKQALMQKLLTGKIRVKV